MANKKVSPEDKKVFTPFTLSAKIKPEIENISKSLNKSMSAFVEEAIWEKLDKCKNEKS